MSVQDMLREHLTCARVCVWHPFPPTLKRGRFSLGLKLCYFPVFSCLYPFAIKCTCIRSMAAEAILRKNTSRSMSLVFRAPSAHFTSFEFWSRLKLNGLFSFFLLFRLPVVWGSQTLPSQFSHHYRCRLPLECSLLELCLSLPSPSSS